MKCLLEVTQHIKLELKLSYQYQTQAQAPLENLETQ